MVSLCSANTSQSALIHRVDLAALEQRVSVTLRGCSHMIVLQLPGGGSLHACIFASHSLSVTKKAHCLPGLVCKYIIAYPVVQIPSTYVSREKNKYHPLAKIFSRWWEASFLKCVMRVVKFSKVWSVSPVSCTYSFQDKRRGEIKMKFKMKEQLFIMPGIYEFKSWYFSKNFPNLIEVRENHYQHFISCLLKCWIIKN